MTTDEIRRLADELEAARAKATAGEWIAWQKTPTSSNDWAGKKQIILPRPLIDKSEVFRADDADFIVFAANNAAAIVAALRELSRQCVESANEIDRLKSVIGEQDMVYQENERLTAEIDRLLSELRAENERLRAWKQEWHDWADRGLDMHDRGAVIERLTKLRAALKAVLPVCRTYGFSALAGPGLLCMACGRLACTESCPVAAAERLVAG